MAMMLLCLLGFFSGQAAVYGVENGQSRLLDGRDGVVDREPCLPFEPVGTGFCALNIVFVLCLRDVGLQVVHVVGDLCLDGAPISSRCSACRLDLLIDLFDRLGRGSARLLFARLNRVVRFLLGTASNASSALLARTDKSASCSESRFVMCLLQLQCS
jgi:hypothetical protein